MQVVKELTNAVIPGKSFCMCPTDIRRNDAGPSHRGSQVFIQATGARAVTSMGPGTG